MKQLYDTDSLLILARECLLRGEQERPELKWLKKQYQNFQEKYNLNKKSETDHVLYERMYGHSPQSSSKCLKIRYWRTGRYTPINREQCLLFGKALELSEEDMIYLIQNYYDHSLNLYETSCDFTEPDYLKKINFMRSLAEEYLENIPKERLEYLKVPQNNPQSSLRHLYFADAFQFIYPPQDINLDILIQHIISIRYDSEFKRHLRLQGEIPRKTIIRHLLILNMPTLTLEKINEQLTLFGYLPLTESHTLIGGEHLDWLLIQLIKMYEQVCNDTDQAQAVTWFQNACRTLDHFFLTEEKPQLRFMHFKALDFSEK